jgi:SNF2 family DNA or RNA helicase
MSLKAELHAQGIAVTGATFNLKEYFRGVGGRWSRPSKAWILPLNAPSLDLCDYLDITLAPEVQDAARELEAAARRIDAWRKCPAPNLPEAPIAAKLPPWTHQLRGYTIAKNLDAAYLGMDMGTGKSAIVVWLAVDAPLTLIICPKAVMPAWRKQFELHADYAHRLMVLDQTGTAKRASQARAFLNPASWPTESEPLPRILICNYESAWRKPLGDLLLAQEWDLAVLDEAHKAKAPGSKQSKWCHRLTSRSRKRLALSGTPTPHDPTDLFSQYKFLDPSMFGTNFTAFRSRYCMMGGFENRQIIGWRNVDELQSIADRIMYQVSSDEVQDLPEISHINLEYPLSAPEARAYAQMKSQLIAEVAAGMVTVTAANGAVKLIRLMQITSGYVPIETYDRDGKRTMKQEPVGTSRRDMLQEFLEGLPQREPVVVFCQFKTDLKSVAEAAEAAGRTCSELSGSADDLAAWQAGDTDVIAVQIQSGSEGIDLTRARYVVYYSHGLSLGKYRQSLKRAHRPGQERKTFVYHIVATGTVDRAIMRALERKQEIIDEIIGDLGRGE